MVVKDVARAKINLTLRILGKLPSGYHALESLIVFADIGDEVRLDPDLPFAVTAQGPFAGAVQGENLVARAMAAVAAVAPDVKGGRFEIDKQIPVAAGLGGGSADAAAALRLLGRVNPGLANIDWQRIAAAVGSDVPVCLESRAALAFGTGDRLAAVAGLPQLWAVLVNANLAVPAAKTRRVFEALAATAIERAPHAPQVPPVGGILDWLREAGNDLEPAARQVIAGMDVIEHALEGHRGCRLVRMSGAGPTWVALFEVEADAGAAAAVVASNHPGWWVRTAHLI